MAFGLLSTQSVSSPTDYRSLKHRRKIFYQFPTGAAPLMGILSMMDDEETDKSEFGWCERRFPTLRTATAASGTAPFRTGDDASAITDNTGDLVADTEYIVVVVSTAQFKPTHVIEIRQVQLNDSSLVNIKGTVTEVVSSTKLKFRPYSSYDNINNATNENNGKTVAIIGTANAEGARSGSGVIAYPIMPTNYTQIFRTAFNATRTVLKGGLVFDKNGPYKMLAKENGLRHMVEMEKAFIFGQKHTVLVTDDETGDITPETKTGGVIWFLEQWEAANSIYRGGSGAAAVTSNSDENKRIINVGGTISLATYNSYISRLFKVTNNKSYEKICLCGGKFLDTVNTLFSASGVIQRQVALEEKTRNFEFIVHTHTTLRGTVHYKVHPLFDEDPDLQGSALFLDTGNLFYRPLTDSDTTFLSGRQENDRDGRKDEWITEAGLECRFPESHMYVYGVTGAA